MKVALPIRRQKQKNCFFQIFILIVWPKVVVPVPGADVPVRCPPQHHLQPDTTATGTVPLPQLEQLQYHSYRNSSFTKAAATIPKPQFNTHM